MKSAAVAGQRFWTVLSNVIHGEVIGLRHDRCRRKASIQPFRKLIGWGAFLFKHVPGIAHAGRAMKSCCY
jgi:hypothetical protein